MQDNSFLLWLVPLGCIFVGGIFGLIFYMRQRRMKESWKGKVVDKSMVSGDNSSDSSSATMNTYYIHVQTDDGQTKRVNVSKKLYDGFSKGDKVEKKAGEYNPVKA